MLDDWCNNVWDAGWLVCGSCFSLEVFGSAAFCCRFLEVQLFGFWKRSFLVGFVRDFGAVQGSSALVGCFLCFCCALLQVLRVETFLVLKQLLLFVVCVEETLDWWFNNFVPLVCGCAFCSVQCVGFLVRARWVLDSRRIWAVALSVGLFLFLAAVLVLVWGCCLGFASSWSVLLVLFRGSVWEVLALLFVGRWLFRLQESERLFWLLLGE